MTALTPKQQRFADLVLSGAEQAEAYRRTYNPHSSPTNARTEGYRLARHPRIAAYIAQQQAKVAAKGITTRTRTLEILHAIATGEKDTTADRIRALRLSAEMQGFLVHRQEMAVGVTPGAANAIVDIIRQVRMRSQKL